MFNTIKDNGLLIAISSTMAASMTFEEYANSLPPGIWMAYSASGCPASFGQPEGSSSGYFYLFFVAQSNVKRVLAFPFADNLTMYTKRGYGSTTTFSWSGWAKTTFTSVGGGVKPVPMRFAREVA